jgi:hypothetical protein
VSASAKHGGVKDWIKSESSLSQNTVVPMLRKTGNPFSDTVLNATFFDLFCSFHKNDIPPSCPMPSPTVSRSFIWRQILYHSLTGLVMVIAFSELYPCIISPEWSSSERSIMHVWFSSTHDHPAIYYAFCYEGFCHMNKRLRGYFYSIGVDIKYQCARTNIGIISDPKQHK